MLLRIKYIIAFLLVNVLFAINGYSQFFLYNEQPIDLDVQFSRHSLEATAKKTFFNVLKIANKSNRSETFSLTFTVPTGWNIIGQVKQEVNLAPYDSIFVPVFIAVGGTVKGDIGYSVIASLTDSRGNTIKNEYCFVKIPRQTNLQIRLVDRLGYLDQITGMSSISLKIENRGNREELVNLLFETDPSIGISSSRQSQFGMDVSIPPFRDSLITIDIQLKDRERAIKNLYRLAFVASTIDTSYSFSMLFRKLDPLFSNFISETQKPLVVEFNAQGLLQSGTVPNYALRAEGKLLLNSNRDIYYYYRNFSSKEPDDFYIDNRMYVGTNLKDWQIELGDSYRSIESPLAGRGIMLAYKTKVFKIEAIGNKNNRNNTLNFGGLASYKISKPLNVKTGFAINQNNSANYDSKLALLGTDFNITKAHKFNIMGAYSTLNQDIDGELNHNGFGGELNYSSQLKKLRTTIRSKYGSDLYAGNFRGRLNANFSFIYSITPTHKINLNGYENWYNNIKIQNGISSSSKSSKNREVNADYSSFVGSKVLLGSGIGFEQFDWQNINPEPFRNYLVSQGYKLNLTGRFVLDEHNTTLTPQITYSQVRIVDFPQLANSNFLNLDKRNHFSYQYISLNFRTKIWGFLAAYTSGPKSIFEQYSYFYYGRNNRRLRILPYIDAFIYKDQLQLQANVSYSNDLVGRSTYTNFTASLYWYLPKDWRVNLLGAYSLQNRQDSRDASQTYQTLYLEAGVKKEFNWSHPRIKYANVNILFFKDYNGNGKQDSNEPGIKNVLAILNRQFSPDKGFIPGDVTSIELLSNNLGMIMLENIPAGVYTINYNPVGKDAGTFSKAEGDLNLNITKSETIYLPFVEKNKVFGKIILNRSRLSGLGKIDLSNVRITATDSQGRSYSTLSDKEGSFILFAPITDEYILTINNIYYENFDLRQNNFRVQFNGYKQFEVNYVFDEKVRRINFAASPGGEVVGGVMQVRRTTLSGSVKDANTQKAVRARVNLINTKTNAVAVSTFSSATSGEYTLSFVAGDTYLIEVLADDYWYMSENLSLNQITTFMSINREVLLKPISVGSKVELNISFAPNSSDLSPEAVAEINRLVRQLRNNPSVRLQVQGHCDDLEALQKSGVALDRANAVIKLLIENGYSNVEARSLGNTVPLVANDTEDGRSRNRRVEVEVISK